MQSSPIVLSSLIEENKHLKDKIHMLTVENGDLKCNCLTLAKGIAEREKKIDKLEKKLTSDGILPLDSWVKSLVESKEEFKERLRMTSIENEDLADECIGLAKTVEMKTNEVKILEERVKFLENEKQSFIEAKKKDIHPSFKNCSKRLSS